MMKIQVAAPFASLRMFSITLFGVMTGVSLANWDAAPIDVHEWGVNTFDWDPDEALAQDLPDYFYTDKRAGEMIAPPDQRVRDLPADSGIRTKPLLYFYVPGRGGRGSSQAQVGIEMRFAYGYANAWWPQVNHYRTEEESQKAGAPDWEAWKVQKLEERKLELLKNNEDGKARERLDAYLADYQKVEEDARIQMLAQGGRFSGNSNFPEDTRMQLVWEHLTLHSGLPENLSLPGSDLKDDHWVKIARDVDAAYVSNGKEVERYVFYEGQTSEEPAIALLPADGGARRSFYGPGRDGERKEVSLVNIGRHTIYDVIAVYRNREKGILWTGYLAMMDPRVVALRVPDFNNPREEDELNTSPEEFRRRTTDRLLENLTAGTPIVSNNISMRDPADAQGPTQRHQLFQKEARGMEKIWHDEFFNAEGLTVIYRESPAYLDEAMPLNIFTSMSWHIRLTRCGLVLNRNLPLEEVYESEQALWDFQLAGWNTHLQDNLKTAVPQLKKNRLLALGQARFHLPGTGGEESSQMKEIRKLLE
ncbi:hypothetical protein V2O64_19315 [Verrucomicrobiaceae bacterium 227]